MAQPGSGAMPKAALKRYTPTGVLEMPSLVSPMPSLPMNPGVVINTRQFPSASFSCMEIQAVVSPTAATTKSCFASFACGNFVTHSGEASCFAAPTTLQTDRSNVARNTAKIFRMVKFPTSQPFPATTFSGSR